MDGKAHGGLREGDPGSLPAVGAQGKASQEKTDDRHCRPEAGLSTKDQNHLYDTPPTNRA